VTSIYFCFSVQGHDCTSLSLIVYTTCSLGVVLLGLIYNMPSEMGREYLASIAYQTIDHLPSIAW
jgi:hypothetical protein